jgi:hypothetical protein
MASDTPRTDKAAFPPPEALVTAVFARELECELAQRLVVRDALAAEVAALKADRDEARRALCMLDAIDRLHDEHPNAPISLCASIRIANEIAVDRGWDCFKGEPCS